MIVTAHGLIEPEDLDLLRSGKLVVVDRGENGPATPDRNGRLVRVNPLNAGQTLLNGTGTYNPVSVTVLPGGDIWLTDLGPSDDGVTPDGRLLRFNPRTGSINQLHTAGDFYDPRGIVQLPNGALLIADSGATDRLVSVRPRVRGQRVLHAGAPLADPRGLAVDSDGTVLVADASGSVLRYSLTADAFTQVTTGPPLDQPMDISRQLTGNLVIADAAGPVDRTRGGSVAIASPGTAGVNEPSGIVAVEICAGKTATIIGTPGNDRLQGSKYPDVIVGGGGNDELVGGNRKDALCGGPGRDTLIGGRGRDTLRGGPGRDRAFELFG